jgi:O-antigen ligase
MANLSQKSDKRSPAYIYLALIFCAFFLYAIIFGHAGGNIRLIAGALIFIAILFFSYYSVAKVFLAFIFLAPFLIGADAYQINIGSFIQNFIPAKDLFINPFSAACLAVVFFVSFELFKKKSEIFRIPLFFILSVSAALSLVIFFGSKYKTDGLVFELYLIAGFMSYFAGYLFFGHKKAYVPLLYTIVLSSIIPVIFAVSQLALGDYLYEGDSGLGRIRASFPHSNTFGSYLFVVVTVMLVLFFAIRMKNKISNAWPGSFLKIFSFSVLFVFLILTYSRTAWIGVALSLLAIGIVRPYFRIPLIYAGSVLTAAILIFEKTRERILGIFEHQMFDSMYGRRETWDMAIFQAKKSPIVGYGIGTFENMIREVQGKETGNVYPHNDLIRFFLEGGILGVALYFLYMLGAIYYSLKSYLKYPKGEEEINIWGTDFLVDFKMLGMIPLLLFVIMVPISFVEAPSMDFVYQILAWTMLGSWLGMSREYYKKDESALLEKE